MSERVNQAKWIESRKRWQINVQKDTVRRTFLSSKENSQSDNEKGKIEAEKKADKWLKEGTKNENVRFEKLYDQFLEETQLLTSKSNYIKHEQMGRLWLSPKLKHKKVVSITEQDWQNCINEAYKAKKSRKTLINIRGSISAFCRYAKKQKLPISRPEDIIIPKDAPQKEKTILQPDDLKKLFSTDTVMHYDKLYFVFFIYAFRFLVATGLRRGELCALKKEDIQNDIVCISRSINSLRETTRGKTANAKRKFVLSENAKKILADQEKFLKENAIISPYIFPNQHGEELNPNYLFDRWRFYRSKVGIVCNLHELRHTFISLAKADAPEELLKRAVGHGKHMDTFGVYGQEVDGEMIRLAGIVDHIFDTVLK